MSNIAPTVQKELDDIQKQMFVAAEKILDDRIVKVSQFDQFKEELDNGKMLDCSWCGKQECEDKIKEETGADIRVITSNEQKSGICVYCKKTGVSTVLFARGY
jgi:prolyl-tRNA synthetase